MARADWSSGYFQAQVFKHLLEEMGYNVSDPGEIELGPNNGYIAMARGEMDFWPNSWYPGHLAWLEVALPDGSLVGDNLEIVGELTTGLEGYLITKSVADRYGITHLDQINDDPRLTALFDADRDGKAEIYGCQESSGPATTSSTARSRSPDGTTSSRSRPAMAPCSVRPRRGLPPASPPWCTHGRRARTSLDSFPATTSCGWPWEEVLDNSNPTGVEGGEQHAQLLGRADIPPEQCPRGRRGGHLPAGLGDTRHPSDRQQGLPPVWVPETRPWSLTCRDAGRC